MGAGVTTLNQNFPLAPGDEDTVALISLVLPDLDLEEPVKQKNSSSSIANNPSE
jgi:hypothetical protein